MATLVLAAAGAAVGGLAGPLGAIAGRAIGAIAGGFADGLIFGKTRHVQGPRLENLRVMSSSEGAPIPRIYGVSRIAGQMIWATNLEEEVTTATSGGKGGGPKVKTTEYRYYANFAIGLCEGEIGSVTRVWADGKPLDLSQITMRVYRGSEDQQPDSLIVSRHGLGNVPAWRGLAYVVFDRLPLERFGNRIPQLSFEVVRPVDDTLAAIAAVNIIPGSGEFFCDPEPVTRDEGAGRTVAENIHAEAGRADWAVSLDQLAAVSPGLQAASLVVSWFGSDLRCGHCDIRPRVEAHGKVTTPRTWSVAGLSRDQAGEVSRINGNPAYGGTPSDASVIAAIRDMRERGLACVFYPFVMMDIPDGNGLADPYTGAANQPVYPWRGRITCDPAPGRPESPDKSSAVTSQLAAFLGTAAADDFHLDGGKVVYSGPDEWGYRRFILHNAWLAKAAGGVEAFLIGSELRGLTWLRDGPASYPFTTALRQLAADVKSILGPDVKVSYAADWSEWFGHHPADGSGDVFFHLDPLWADDNIDFIGIDNYMPLSDWREGLDHADARAGAASIYDLEYLKSNIAGGEGYDWYYPALADRDAQYRAPITDGAYGKPWVFRYKDIRNWWENHHYDRPGGVEAGAPTAWTPRSKPVWFTECGCPAVDMGTNQPNVFFDPKSAESALPHYSSGRRDDAIQRQYIATMLEYWRADNPDNPHSDVYGGPMVEPSRIFFWAWDARPWPAFPLRADVWSDAANHELGHWLNGRLGQAPLSELLRAILRDCGFADFRIGDIGAMAGGYVIDRPMSARAAIEPLASAFSFGAVESAGEIVFSPDLRRPALRLEANDLAERGRGKEDGAPLFEITRAQGTELPSSQRLEYLEPARDHRSAVARAHFRDGKSGREDSLSIAAAMPQSLALARASVMLAQARAGRETLDCVLPPSLLAMETGDVIELDTGGAGVRQWRIEQLSGGLARQARLRAFDPSVFVPPRTPARAGAAALPAVFGPPDVLLLDIPPLRDGDSSLRLWAAAAATPWPGAVSLMRNVAGTWEPAADITRPAVMGETLDGLPAGPLWRLDRAASVRVRLNAGVLSSVTDAALLAGANAAAIGAPGAGWEILQFRDAELLEPGVWRISMLLRGQRGSEPEMPAIRPAGARFVLLDSALAGLSLSAASLDQDIRLKAGPASRPHNDASWREIGLRYAGLPARPFAPAHLRARRMDNGDIRFTWMRRARIGGDPWGRADIPLAEESESYQLTIMNGASPARVITVPEPAAIWSAAQQAADFPSGVPDPLIVRAAQVSALWGPGAITEKAFHV